SLFAVAFADRAVADDVSSFRRYNAACMAALAGCGQGNDAGKLDDQQKAGLRAQAQDWLQADLTLWTKKARGNAAAERGPALDALRGWQRDADLAGVREPAALAKLPKE